MGIATAVKEIFRSDSASSEEFDASRRTGATSTHDKDYKLPSGTGTGTLGKRTSAHAQPQNATSPRAHNAVDFENSSAPNATSETARDANDYKLPAGTGPGTLGKGGAAGGADVHHHSGDAKGRSGKPIGIPVAAGAAGAGATALAKHDNHAHDQ